MTSEQIRMILPLLVLVMGFLVEYKPSTIDKRSLNQASLKLTVIAVLAGGMVAWLVVEHQPEPLQEFRLAFFKETLLALVIAFVGCALRLLVSSDLDES